MAQTTPPTLTAPPPAPQTSDGRLVFPGKADTFVAWFATQVSQMTSALTNVYDNAVDAFNSATTANTRKVEATAAQSAAANSAADADLSVTQALAALANVNAAPGTTGTSVTSQTPSLGAFTFVTQSGKGWTAGQALAIVSRGDPTAFIDCTVTSYSGTSLVVAGVAFGGQGAHADWDIQYLGALPLPTGRPGQVLSNDGRRPKWGDPGRRKLRAAENLLLRSGDLTHGAWSNASITVGTAVVGVFGTVTARPLTMGDAAASLYQAATVVAGQPYTFQLCVKQGDSPYSDIILYDGGDLNTGLRLTFATRAVSVSFFGSSREVLAYGAESIGGGWFLLWATCIPSTATIVGYSFPAGITDGNGLYSIVEAPQITAGIGPAQYVATTTASASGAGALRASLALHTLYCDTAVGGFGLGAVATRVGRAVAPSGAAHATIYSFTAGSDGISVVVATVIGNAYTARVWVRVISGAPVGKILIPDGGEPGLDVPSQLPTLSDGTWHEVTYSWTAQANNETVYLNYASGASTIIAFWNLTIVPGYLALAPRVNGADQSDGEAHADIETRTVNLIDTNEAAISLAIPVMEDGEWFDILDSGGYAATNKITLLLGWLPTIDGVAEDFVIDLNGWGGRFTFVYGKGLVIT